MKLDRGRRTPAPEAAYGSAFPRASRFALYTLVIFVLTYSLPLVVDHGGHELFAENGLIEWIQFGMLFGSAGVLLASAWLIGAYRELLVVLSCGQGFAAVRELDSVLDQWVPVIGWKFGLLLPLLALGLIVRRWQVFRAQFARFLTMPAFFVFWAGFVLAVPVAQLVGHGPLLQTLMGDDYNAHYKRVIEETGELIGYVLLVAATVECLINVVIPLYRGAQPTPRPLDEGTAG